MKRLPIPGWRRALPAGRASAAAALAAVLAAGALSACDASPYAASVNGTTIQEANLNTQLRSAASASDYSAGLTGAYKSVYGVTLSLTGATSNTYSSPWTAYTLSQMIQGQLVRQAEAARGAAPSSALYTAALGGIEIENNGVTGPQGTGGVTQMNPVYLVGVTQSLADHADLETPLPTATLQPLYADFKAEFYTQVCVTQASVSVAGPNGAVDFAASQTQASALAQQLSSGGAKSTGAATGGASTCYTHVQLDAQSAALIDTVVSLAPGHAVSQKTTYGYQVTAVTSRQTQPLAGPVAQVLTTLVYELGQPNGDTVLRRLESQAHVKVNVTYGSWHPPNGTTPASVVAPSASPATPVGTPGVLTSAGDPLGT